MTKSRSTQARAAAGRASTPTAAVIDLAKLGAGRRHRAQSHPGLG